MEAPAPLSVLLFARIRSPDVETAGRVLHRLKLEFGPEKAVAATETGNPRPSIGELKVDSDYWLGFPAAAVDPLRLPDFQLHAYRLERLYGSPAAEPSSEAAPPSLRINFGYALPRQIVIAERCAAPNRLLIGGDPPADPVYAEIVLARNESGDWRQAATPNAEPRFPHAVVDFLTALAARHPASAASSSSAPAAAS